MNTQRLKLEPFSLEKDIPFHIELMNSENWLKYIGDRNVHSEEDFLKFYRERFQKITDKGYLNFVLTKKETGEKIGTCGLYKRESLAFADIGYALLPQHEGNGYIVEAIPLVIDYYFKNFAANILAAFTGKENIASQKILLKTGFVKIDERLIPPYEDTNIYFEYTRK
ncbi:MAG: GNAT family N-acetyltransferase [Cloacibacterium sp.]|jgi:RimJ/RimL family protein N-acetyltransferase|nr:GNAT family N-acetyltransferase [Cloacibacterium sp.]